MNEVLTVEPRYLPRIMMFHSHRQSNTRKKCNQTLVERNVANQNVFWQKTEGCLGDISISCPKYEMVHCANIITLAEQ